MPHKLPLEHVKLLPLSKLGSAELGGGREEERTAGPDQSWPKSLHTYISEAKGPRAHSLGLKQTHIFAKLLAALSSYK